jgi:hypothetical protein
MDQVAAVSDDPVTVAAKARVLQASTAPGEGVTEMVTGGGGAVTVTVAVSLRVGSSTLLATTWHVAAVAGAVYTPAALTDPQPEASETDQVTAGFAAPATAAVKETVPPVETVAERGLTDTVTGALGVTVTTTTARFVG